MTDLEMKIYTAAVIVGIIIGDRWLWLIEQVVLRYMNAY